MAGRRTNLGLLALLLAALATGTAAYATGTPAAARVVVVAHAVVGLALLILSPAKSVIVRRGLRRPRAGKADSIAFGVLILLTVATGVAHAAGWVAVGGLRLLLVHVGAALLAIPLGVRHVSTRPVAPRRTDWSRRTLLKAGGVVGGGGLVVVATEGIVTAGGLPGAQRRQTGSHEAGTGHPEQMPVTQWIADAVPSIDPTDYRLRLAVAGAATTFTLAQLRRPGDRVTATLDCTGGWFAVQEWAGTRLDRLVGDTGGARSVVVRSATGYTRRFPLRDLPHLLLATDVAGSPLSAGHGAPLRLVAPGRRGFWWVKWVTDVTIDDRPWWLQPPFPLQ
jgi:hypothetical protein